MMKIWKELKDHKGYWVSNYGEVVSYRKNNSKKLHNIPKLLKNGISINQFGRKYYYVSINGKSKKVHRIVAETFIENPLNKPFVNHIDNNGLNNKLDNLEWVTTSENQIHYRKFINNYSGLGKYICKNGKYFIVKKNGIFCKYFKTLEEAKEFAKQYY